MAEARLWNSSPRRARASPETQPRNAQIEKNGLRKRPGHDVPHGRRADVARAAADSQSATPASRREPVARGLGPSRPPSSGENRGARRRPCRGRRAAGARPPTRRAHRAPSRRGPRRRRNSESSMTETRAKIMMMSAARRSRGRRPRSGRPSGLATALGAKSSGRRARARRGLLLDRARRISPPPGRRARRRRASKECRPRPSRNSRRDEQRRDAAEPASSLTPSR